jgi:hypothetical protein
MERLMERTRTSRGLGPGPVAPLVPGNVEAASAAHGLASPVDSRAHPPPPGWRNSRSCGLDPRSPLLDDAARRLRLPHVLRDAVRWALCTSPVTGSTEIASRVASSRRSRCAEAPASVLRWGSMRSVRETFVRVVRRRTSCAIPTAPPDTRQVGARGPCGGGEDLPVLKAVERGRRVGVPTLRQRHLIGELGLDQR